MKASELKGLSVEELKEKLAVEVEGYHKLKLTKVISELENPAQIKTKRRFIATLKTELNKR